jgi:hypothetical protein
MTPEGKARISASWMYGYRCAGRLAGRRAGAEAAALEASARA